MSEDPKEAQKAANLAAKAERKAAADKKAAAPKKPRTPKPADYMPRMKQRYTSEIRAALKEQFKYTNDMQIPRLDKIVINMGVGEATARLQEADRPRSKR